MAAGFKGGQSLAQTGFNQAIITVILIGMLMALVIPAWSYLILRRGVGLFDAAAIAATYGSVSAVTFTVATQFVASHQLPTSGGATVALVFMESPAIVMAVLLASWARAREGDKLAGRAATSAEMEAVMPETVATESKTPVSVKAVLHEAFTDGAHLLLIGSLLVGAITGPKGLKPCSRSPEVSSKGFWHFSCLRWACWLDGS